MATAPKTINDPIEDQHQLAYYGASAELLFWRERGDIRGQVNTHDTLGVIPHAAAKLFDEILQTLLLEPAQKLPAVEHYFTMKNRDAGVAAELERIELDRKQCELDRQKALADLAGEKLAATLAKCSARSQALAQRIAECQEGARLFADEVEAARASALDALNAYLAQTSPQLLAEAKKRLSAAEAVVGSLIGDMSPLLSSVNTAAAAADVVVRFKDADALLRSGGGRFSAGNDVERRLKAILAEPPAAAGEEG